MEYKIDKSFPRPKRFLGPALGTAPLMLALIGVARASGSGWVQVIGAIVSATVLLGILAPMVIILRNKIFIEEIPHFLVAKNENFISVKATKTCKVEIERSPVSYLTPNIRSSVIFIPNYLGTLSLINLTISTAAPFGIVWWYRKITLTFDRPLLVLAPTGSPDYNYTVEFSEFEQLWRPSSNGQIRGARDYVYGDSLRNANWKTSAHVGKLQIKEFEIPKSEIITIKADLYGSLDEIEAHAERIVGTVQYLLKLNQCEVFLQTSRNSAPKIERIQTLRQAQIQLAESDITPTN